MLKIEDFKQFELTNAHKVKGGIHGTVNVTRISTWGGTFADIAWDDCTQTVNYYLDSNDGSTDGHNVGTEIWSNHH